MLSKKYYRDIAYILATTKASRKQIDEFKRYFQGDNYRFDGYRFDEYIKDIKKGDK